MPRPRFERLSEEKRKRILNAAAQEFAIHGYETASLNKILEAAGISKGAAYYYFDDKEDLHNTTLHYCLQELAAAQPLEVDHFGRESFWSEVASLYRHQYAHFAAQPWILSMAKAGGAQATPQQGLLAQIVERGQALGTVRNDLPADLLQDLMGAVDAAHDRWLYARWADLSEARREDAVEGISDTLKRLLTPKVAGQRKPLWWRWASKIAPYILRDKS